MAQTLKKRTAKQKAGTTLTLRAEELLELAKYVAAGTVLFQRKTPVASRLKSALSRLGIQPTAGI
jgi:hypothetical protein